MDALGGIDLNGTLAGRGAEWSLGSSSIGILPIGASRDALSINSRLLAALNGAGAVRLASTGLIDVYSPVRLGVNSSNAPTLQSLILAGSSLNNPNGATSIQFGAQTLTLEGSGGSASAPTAGPAGTTLSLFGGNSTWTERLDGEWLRIDPSGGVGSGDRRGHRCPGSRRQSEP